MTVKISILLPSLHERLACRAAASLAAHGMPAGEIELRFIIINPPDAAPWIDFESPSRGISLLQVSQPPAGVNAALRAGLKAIIDASSSADRPDHIVIAADDVIYKPGWLEKLWGGYLKAVQRFNGKVIMGIRHAGGIGTCWGHMYANFPIFPAALVLNDPYILENFMPSWLRGQWGDVALSLACWRAGGVVVDSNTGILVAWSDRMGYPEAVTKGASDGDDMAAMVERFGPAFGYGWGHGFRDFNIDCPFTILRDGTVRVPRASSFDRVFKDAMAMGGGLR